MTSPFLKGSSHSDWKGNRMNVFRLPDTGFQPLVSFVTPVFNGEAFLEECIESVLSQEWHNWDYVIVDNASTDRTPQIAARYASMDPRIRVIRNATLLPLMENLNRAMMAVNPLSRYCKVVHADDSLMPKCVPEMVSLAESSPSIGIVGAYGISGNRILWTGLPPGRSVFNGRTVLRNTLRGDYYVFGSPSTILIRTSVLNEKADFYNPLNRSGDVEACFRILFRYDFGFVHKILTRTRFHHGSQTHIGEKLRPEELNAFLVLKKWGPELLTQAEFRSHFKNAEKRLAKAIIEARVTGNLERLDYYHKALEAIGETRRMEGWKAFAALCRPAPAKGPLQRARFRRTLVKLRFLLVSDNLVENREELRLHLSLEKIEAAWKLFKHLRLARFSKLLHGAGWRKDFIRLCPQEIGDFRLLTRKDLMLFVASILRGMKRL
jgi:glycosyltransferase involved in cell wall biosynthesis